MAQEIAVQESRREVTFAVIGAGNGGQAMAGDLSLHGFPVNLWNRSREKVESLNRSGGILLEGEINGFARPDLVTASMREAVEGARVIMVTVPASGHRDVARAMAPWLSDGQIVVLNPGRTGGVLEFRKVLLDNGCRKDVTLAEAGTFIYASRTVAPGRLFIYGIKRNVPVAALPATRTMEVVRVLRYAFPQFIPAESVLYTSFDNIGAIFHPLPTILNAGRIESGLTFEHYKEGITPSVARALETLDAERMAVASAFGVHVRPVLQWMHETYGVKAQNIHEAVTANPSYEGIRAPGSLDTRYIFEDVPFSLVPLVALGRIAGVKTPLMRSVISIASALHGVDYWAIGRKAKDMGLLDLSVRDIVRLVLEGGLES
ncbi:MAG: NAD/NADP octopine/nopaline dehydrogenase family protein [Candidatus Fermentithermobacillus carboniphilus]|uniref:NAD/NADP octopine/nopaline dehydrogenase family protein n=1 Tax=Candidatus Fermentithermobacillus carboniphilus TaxID=3085328 RepID=A0AAT9L9B2_9FIRM|nr:MAG: NAD/NADP octopine/nopaline dehydrogenase family protein [Candidatus Fermentithermobacillus carboniphilus]